MKPHPLASLAATSLLVLCAAPGFSQVATPRSAPAPPPPPSPALAVPAPVVAPEKRFDIQLDGGIPAQEATARIAEKLRQPVNVIFTGDSAETPLPALRLHQVTLPEFFAAVQAAGQIEAMNGRAGYGFAPVDGAPNIYTFSVQPPPAPEARSTFPTGLVVGSVGGTVGAPTLPTPQKTSLFFDLSTILNDELTIEDITTAIRAAWTAADDGKEPSPEALKFHQETKLLIATGFPARLDTVTNIVKLLLERNRPSEDAQSKQINEVTQQRRLAEEMYARRLSEAEDQYNRITKKLDQTEKEKDEQIKELRNRLAELEIELAKREAKR